MNRLILVEGLPGTGKTTISQWIHDLLWANMESAELLLENDERMPSNFSDMAGVLKDVFYSLFSNRLATIDKRTENFIYPI